MFEFESACKEVERLDIAERAAFVRERSKKVIETLMMFTEDEVSATAFFTGFLLGAVISDGTVKKQEFDLIKPMMDVAYERDFTYEEACETIRKLAPDPKRYNDFVDRVTDFFGQMSDAIKKDVIAVCLLVTAADGKISFRERQWLKKLAK